MSNPSWRTNSKTRKQSWLSKFISGFFWVLLILTIVYIVFVIFVPTAQEWDSVTGSSGKFPSGFTLSNVASAIIRHLARFSTNITIQFIVIVINFVFWTMFVYNIDADINYGIEHGGKVATYVYVEWALGSLISGIIFLSTSLASVSNNVFDVADKIIYVGAIVTFALVAYYFLYNLRDKLKKEKD